MSDLSELEKRLGVSRRTDLYLWFHRNAAEFAALVERAGGQRSVSWLEVAVYLNEKGVVGRGGKRVSPDMARKAWERASRKAAQAGGGKPVPVVRPLTNGSGEAQASRFIQKLAGDDVPIPLPITKGA